MGTKAFNDFLNDLTSATPAAADVAAILQGGNTRKATLQAIVEAVLGGGIESGTWTPVLDRIATSPSVTYSTQAGAYLRLGQIVIASCVINASSISGGSGRNMVTGIPFPIINDSSFIFTSALSFSTVFSTLTKTAHARPASSNTGFFFLSDTANVNSQLNENYSGSGELDFSMIYLTD